MSRPKSAVAFTSHDFVFSPMFVIGRIPPESVLHVGQRCEDHACCSLLSIPPPLRLGSRSVMHQLEEWKKNNDSFLDPIILLVSDPSLASLSSSPAWQVSPATILGAKAGTKWQLNEERGQAIAAPSPTSRMPSSFPRHRSPRDSVNYCPRVNCRDRPPETSRKGRDRRKRSSQRRLNVVEVAFLRATASLFAVPVVTLQLIGNVMAMPGKSPVNQIVSVFLITKELQLAQPAVFSACGAFNSRWVCSHLDLMK